MKIQLLNKEDTGHLLTCIIAYGIAALCCIQTTIEHGVVGILISFMVLSFLPRKATTFFALLGFILGRLI